jgi:hypothetical protein
MDSYHCPAAMRDFWKPAFLLDLASGPVHPLADYPLRVRAQGPGAAGWIVWK